MTYLLAAAAARAASQQIEMMREEYWQILERVKDFKAHTARRMMEKERD